MTLVSKKHLSAYALAAILVAVVFTLNGTNDPYGISLPSAPQNYEIHASSVEETLNALSFEVGMPQYLPQGIEFDSSNVSKDGQSAVTIFANENLTVEYYVQQTDFDPIKALDSPSNPVTITVEENGKVVSTKTLDEQHPNYTKTTINGVDAVLVDADENTQHKLAWYKNGVFYTVSADLSSDELVRIGNSIQ